ncbi:MAG: alpha/beta hydrolase family protein [Rhodospirillaceae bacterium]
MYKIDARRAPLMAVFAASLIFCAPGTSAFAEEKIPSAAANPATANDPKPDPDHPARLIALLVPSGGSMMNAVLFKAAGAGNHPTLLLLHGMPGNEQNLDVAYAARRAGWSVLTFHPRGS